jgi:hypothetical protein
MTSNRLIGSKAKIGLDLRYREESRTRFEPDSHSSSVEKPKNLRSQDTPQKQFSPSFRAIYDDMIVDHLRHRGFRTIVHSGPIFEETGTHARHDIEVFAFDDFSNADVNLGFHLFMGKTTSQSYESQFYLGGFDSVRGLPDGVMYGSTAAYANFELRFIAHRMKYAWFQTATFFDVGSASDRIGELSRESRSSAGVGLRIAVPQVYRLLLRLDYAWSCDDTGSSGVSLGMNQFFQPYKPL